MIRYTLLFCLFAMTLMTTAATDARADSGPREFYEIRSYVLNEGASAEAIDGYLKEALIPALQRHGAGPVGVFSNSENDETGSTRVIVAIPFDNAAAAAEAQQKLKSDSVYQQAAEQHMSLARNEIPYRRVESELLVAMQCMPQLKVPSKMMDNEDR